MHEKLFTLQSSDTDDDGDVDDEEEVNDGSASKRKWINSFFLQLLNNSVEKSIYKKLANVEELMNKY